MTGTLILMMKVLPKLEAKVLREDMVVLTGMVLQLTSQLVLTIQVAWLCLLLLTTGVVLGM